MLQSTIIQCVMYEAEYHHRTPKSVGVWRLTIEIDVADVLQQLLAPRLLHLWTDAPVVSTQVLVHVMQGMSHSVDGINHELNLALLLIVGIFPDSLLPCT